MTHVTCRLTAKNQDQLWNPTLGSRVWAIFLTYDLSYDHHKFIVRSTYDVELKRTKISLRIVS